MFDKMIDMQRTPLEQEQSGSPVPSENPVYPYGLSLTLTNEELEKLGLDCEHQDCQVGNFLQGHFLAEVTGYSKNASESGERHNLNIQITHLELEDEQAENDEADEENYEGKIYRAAGPY